MNMRKAVVLRVEGGSTLVKVGGDGGCGRCNEAGGCGGDVLGKLFGGRCGSYRVETDQPLAPGAEIVVAVGPRAPLLAAALAYGIPLLGVLLGAAVGAQRSGDAGAVLGAIVGLVSSSAVSMWLTRRKLAGGLAVRVVDSGMSH